MNFNLANVIWLDVRHAEYVFLRMCEGIILVSAWGWGKLWLIEFLLKGTWYKHDSEPLLRVGNFCRISLFTMRWSADRDTMSAALLGYQLWLSFRSVKSQIRRLALFRGWRGEREEGARVATLPCHAVWISDGNSPVIKSKHRNRPSIPWPRRRGRMSSQRYPACGRFKYITFRLRCF